VVGSPSESRKAVGSLSHDLKFRSSRQNRKYHVAKRLEIIDDGNSD
jgi:hypothetical protein